MARRRGRAAGRGWREARGVGFANLRRRSPRYVYLGLLTPALPAGAPVRSPARQWATRRSPRRSGEGPRGLWLRSEGRRRGRYGPGAHGSGWGGGGAAALVAPARPSPRPRPGAPPPQPLTGRPGLGDGRGKFEIPPELPRPASSGASPGPPMPCGSPSRMTRSPRIAPSPLHLRHSLLPCPPIPDQTHTGTYKHTHRSG